MRSGKALCVFFCLLCLLAFKGRAAEEIIPAKQGKMRALLIGCDHFVTKEDTWPAAEQNVRMLSDVLMADERRYSLIRSYSDSIATEDAFESAVLNAFQNAGEEDISLLYISTHGVLEMEDGRTKAGLLLSDGTEENVLDAETLQDTLDLVPGLKVVILDACNSGAIIGKGLSGGADRCYLTGDKYKVLCSAGGSEASWYFQHGSEAAAGGASYFATVLSNGLGARGDHAADQNADGEITLRETYLFLLDNYAASTVQAYPQFDDDFVIFSYDHNRPWKIEKAVTDITFEETLLTAGQTAVTFSFTVQRQVEVYYQIVYHQNGEWQFEKAQHFLDGEQADGTVLPGRKQRTISLNTIGQEAYGYVIVQLITREEGMPVFQGARLLCVQPENGEIHLRSVTASSFVPALGQELPILIEHDMPCGLTVNILNENGKAVRKLCYETPSRPQQLTPSGSTFYWDGRKNNGEWADEGLYTVQVKVRMNGVTYQCQSEPFQLTNEHPFEEPEPNAALIDTEEE